MSSVVKKTTTKTNQLTNSPVVSFESTEKKSVVYPKRCRIEPKKINFGDFQETYSPQLKNLKIDAVHAWYGVKKANEGLFGYSL